MANLSQIKRQKMLDFLDTIRQEHKDDDEALIAINEIENELNEKKYGLVWERHEEAVDVQMRDNIPVFTECKDKEIAAAPGEGYNFILEGDNLHSLRLLEKTHSGKIDVIYIDPPYNTGNNDFIYEDRRIGTNDGYRHSKWLSFMAERLQIAKRLLSDSGCIFISIDNNEFAQLKLLCDEIFNEDNFIGSLIWQKKTGGGQTDEFFVTEHEYILGYRASSKFKWKDTWLEVSEDSYKYQDDKGRFNLTKLEKWGSASHREDRLSMYFPITDPDGNEFYPVAPDGKPGRWRVGKDTMNSLIGDELVYWKKNKERWVPYEKQYFNPC